MVGGGWHGLMREVVDGMDGGLRRDRGGVIGIWIGGVALR